MGNVVETCHADEEARMRRPLRSPADAPVCSKLAPRENDGEVPASWPVKENCRAWPPIKMDILFKEHLSLLKEAGLETGSWKAGGISPEDTLLVLDIQNDFIPGKFAPHGGRAAIPEGEATIEPVVELIEAFSRRGALIIATRDYHPADHCSFNDEGGPLPSHCIQATAGSFFYPDVAKALHKAYTEPTCAPGFDGLPGRPGRVEVAFKGFVANVDSPSAFRYDEDSFRQRVCHRRLEQESSSMHAWTGAMALKCSCLLGDINASPDLDALLQNDLRPLDSIVPRSGRLLIVGLALDSAVLDTIANAAQLGYEQIYVAIDACRPQHFAMSGEYGSGFFTDPAFIASQLKKYNVEVVQSSDVLRTSQVLGGA